MRELDFEERLNLGTLRVILDRLAGLRVQAYNPFLEIVQPGNAAVDVEQFLRDLLESGIRHSLNEIGVHAAEILPIVVPGIDDPCEGD
ncbi:uncharacterized protein N7511_009571 [Penicillium nucicola]|uniref:uncharacterized protein n=1 Tax=Penicillium nucicola TaxID=1850975 RepID=UPI0025450C2D|nr:uncharacterized protein N7511_009571 [Penicillium nucicola]KAJ5747875.1 hypothetical protein N7511_009571 [Penicillium nucicola]